jgi:hypothetical protein
VGSAAVAAHVLKEADGIAGLEEFVEEVEGEIEAQAGRVEIAAVADEDRRCGGGRRIEGNLLSSHGSSLDDGLVRWFQIRGLATGELMDGAIWGIFLRGAESCLGRAAPDSLAENRRLG